MATANLPEAGLTRDHASQQPFRQELSGVVIGWKHRAFARNIHLTVQSSSHSRPTPNAVDSHHLLMTRNQALLLANYLIRVTGQEPPALRRRSLWKRLFG